MSLIRVAILGSGWGLNIQLPAFKLAGFEVVAVGVRSEEKATALRQQHPSIHFSTNWKSLVELENVDLVSVVTPPHLHVEQALAALAAGKSVICDKPFALNVNEALRAAEAKPTPGRIAIIDHELRCTDIFAHIKAELQEKKSIGEIRHISVDFYSRRDFNAPATWWDDASLGGGLLGAVGSHLIDSVSYLSGDRIVEVSGCLTRVITQRKKSPDSAEGCLLFVTDE